MELYNQKLRDILDAELDYVDLIMLGKLIELVEEAKQDGYEAGYQHCLEDI